MIGKASIERRVEMARTPTTGATCLMNENLVIKGGADFFDQFRYDVAAPNGGRDPVDMSNWKGYLAFGHGSKRVLECNECLLLTEDGWVSMHLPPYVTKWLSEQREGDVTYDYEIVLVTDQGFVVPFVEGEALVTDMLVEIPFEPVPNEEGEF